MEIKGRDLVEGVPEDADDLRRGDPRGARRAGDDHRRGGAHGARAHAARALGRHHGQGHRALGRRRAAAQPRPAAARTRPACRWCWPRTRWPRWCSAPAACSRTSTCCARSRSAERPTTPLRRVGSSASESATARASLFVALVVRPARSWSRRRRAIRATAGARRACSKARPSACWRRFARGRRRRRRRDSRARVVARRGAPRARAREPASCRRRSPSCAASGCGCSGLDARGRGAGARAGVHAPRGGLELRAADVVYVDRNSWLRALVLHVGARGARLGPAGGRRGGPGRPGDRDARVRTPRCSSSPTAPRRSASSSSARAGRGSLRGAGAGRARRSTTCRARPTSRPATAC